MSSEQWTQSTVSKKRDKGIIAYGTQEDRDKLALIASLMECSSSEAIIKMIRDKYELITTGTCNEGV